MKYIRPIVFILFLIGLAVNAFYGAKPAYSKSWWESEYRLTEREIDRLLSPYGWPLIEAKKIAWCESNWSPNARRTDTGRFRAETGDWGLFQINGVHRWRAPSAVWDLYENQPPSEEAVEANIEFAYRLYREKGWSPWSCKVGQRWPAVEGDWELASEPLPTLEHLSVKKVHERFKNNMKDWQLTTEELDIEPVRRLL